MEDIRFNCPYCSRNLVVNRRGAGLRVPCPECGREIVVPTRAETKRLKKRAANGSRPPTLRLNLTVPPRHEFVLAGWACVTVAALVIIAWPGLRLVQWGLAALTSVCAVVVLLQRRWANGIMLAWSAALLALMPALGLIERPQPTAVVVEPAVRPAGKPSAAMLPQARPSPEGGLTRRAAGAPAAPAGVVAQPARAPAEVRQVAMAPAPPPGPGGAPVAPAARPVRAVTVRPPGIARPPPLRAQFEDEPRPRVDLPFVLYADCEGVQPYCPSGWMGNISAIDINDCWSEGPHSGKACIKCTYYGRGNWAGVAWQDPPNNWGDWPGGYDITGAAKVSFWARGETGAEHVEFKVGILGVSKKFPDSARATTGKIHLSTQWQQYSIDLAGKNLQRMISGFVWVVEGGASPITFYLDDVQYE